MIDFNDTAADQPSASRNRNLTDVMALPDGMMTSVEHFKAMVRRVQDDAKFREGLEEYAKARKEMNRQAGIEDLDSGIPVWLIAARSPEKYSEVLKRLEYVCFWAEEKLKRRIQAEGLKATAEMHEKVMQEIESKQ